MTFFGLKWGRHQDMENRETHLNQEFPGKLPFPAGWLYKGYF